MSCCGEDDCDCCDEDCGSTFICNECQHTFSILIGEDGPVACPGCGIEFIKEDEEE